MSSTQPDRIAYECNFFCNGGPSHGRMLQLRTTLIAGEHVRLDDLFYEIMDGPAYQVARKSGKSHPNLAANLRFVEALTALHSTKESK